MNFVPERGPRCVNEIWLVSFPQRGDHPPGEQPVVLTGYQEEPQRGWTARAYQSAQMMFFCGAVDTFIPDSDVFIWSGPCTMKVELEAAPLPPTYPTTLLQFMEDPDPAVRNVFVSEGELDMYVRKAAHVLCTEDARFMALCLDIGSISAQRRGGGTLTRAIPFLKEVAAKHDLWLRIENVHVERFQEFWKRQGFLETRDGGGTPSFWWGPAWEMKAGPLQVHAYRSQIDNKLVVELEGPVDGQPQDSGEGDSPTARIWINEALIDPGAGTTAMELLKKLANEYVRNRTTEHEFITTKTLHEVPRYWREVLAFLGDDPVPSKPLFPKKEVADG